MESIEKLEELKDLNQRAASSKLIRTYETRVYFLFITLILLHSFYAAKQDMSISNIVTQHRIFADKHFLSYLKFWLMHKSI